MINISIERLNGMDHDYPGIKDSILEFENKKLPDCPECFSGNTASVQVGVIRRTMNMAVATTKFKLVANCPKPGAYYCNFCEQFFDIDKC